MVSTRSRNSISGVWGGVGGQGVEGLPGNVKCFLELLPTILEEEGGTEGWNLPGDSSLRAEPEAELVLRTHEAMT